MTRVLIRDTERKGEGHVKMKTDWNDVAINQEMPGATRIPPRAFREKLALPSP